MEKKKLLINNTGNFAHALPIRAAENNLEMIIFSDRSPDKVRSLEGLGQIRYLEGGIYGGETTKILTTELVIRENIADVDFIVLSNYATEHEAFFRKYGKQLKEEQEVILLSPGVAAALEMRRVLNEMGCIFPRITEVDTCPFACKVPKIGVSNIKTEKREILYTSILGQSVGNVDPESIITQLFPQSRFVESPYMNLDDSTCFHVMGMLVNSERIKRKENFNFYINDGMKNVSSLMVEFDEERCEVARRVGLTPRPIKVWLNKVYGVEMRENLFEMIEKTPPYMNGSDGLNRSPAPSTLQHRYLGEEIPLKLVPTYFLGRTLGLEMSLHEKYIKEAGKLLYDAEEYYFINGRKVSLNV